MQTYHTDQAPEAIGPYSQAISADGWLFTSGQIGIDPPTGEIVEGGFRGSGPTGLDQPVECPHQCRVLLLGRGQGHGLCRRHGGLPRSQRHVWRGDGCPPPGPIDRPDRRPTQRSPGRNRSGRQNPLDGIAFRLAVGSRYSPRAPPREWIVLGGDLLDDLPAVLVEPGHDTQVAVARQNHQIVAFIDPPSAQHDRRTDRAIRPVPIAAKARRSKSGARPVAGCAAIGRGPWVEVGPRRAPDPVDEQPRQTPARRGSDRERASRSPALQRPRRLAADRQVTDRPRSPGRRRRRWLPEARVRSPSLSDRPNTHRSGARQPPPPRVRLPVWKGHRWPRRAGHRRSRRRQVARGVPGRSCTSTGAPAALRRFVSSAADSFLRFFNWGQIDHIVETLCEQPICSSNPFAGPLPSPRLKRSSQRLRLPDHGR